MTLFASLWSPSHYPPPSPSSGLKCGPKYDGDDGREEELGLKPPCQDWRDGPAVKS